MKQHSDRRIVYTALAGNFLIAVMKFIAAGLSGSSAMLAEGFHSTVDTLNQAMLLIGLKRSSKPPDEDHPFGYGKVIYFWAFVVSISIFFVGGALSVFEGIRKILDPEPIQSLTLPLIVLGISFLFECYPWWVAYSEAKRLKKGTGLMSYVDMAERSKNPTVLVVLLENSAALLGLLVAGLGITLAYTTGVSAFDAIASITIGLILVAVAIFLAKETKGLLIGESASKEDRERIRKAIESIESVKQSGRLLTMHMGSHDILVNVDVEFVDGLSTDQLENAIDLIETNIKEAVPEVKRIYIEAEPIKMKLPKENSGGTSPSEEEK